MGDGDRLNVSGMDRERENRGSTGLTMFREFGELIVDSWAGTVRVEIECLLRRHCESSIIYVGVREFRMGLRGHYE